MSPNVSAYMTFPDRREGKMWQSPSEALAERRIYAVLYEVMVHISFYKIIICSLLGPTDIHLIGTSIISSIV